MSTLTEETIMKSLKEMRNKSKKRNFNETVEVIISLRNVDLKKTENRLNEIFQLPEGPGRNVKICLFATGELESKGKKLGRDKVINKDELSLYLGSKKETKKLASQCDFFIAQADLMATIGRSMGAILSPRGKMPIPIPPTANLKPLIDKLKKSVRIIMRKQPVVQVPVGKVEMPDKALAKNIKSVISFIESRYSSIPHAIKAIYIKTTMGPSIKIA